MPAELNQKAQELAEKYWPLPPNPDREWVEQELAKTAWQQTPYGWLLPGCHPGPVFSVFSPLFSSGSPRDEARKIVVLATLCLLAMPDLPREKTVFFTGDDPIDIEPPHLFIPISGDTRESVTPEKGKLVIFSSRLGPEEFSLLLMAGKALHKAGILPELVLVEEKKAPAILGFSFPGRPEKSPDEFAGAVTACAGLIYGLTGYRTLAFNFDD